MKVKEKFIYLSKNLRKTQNPWEIKLWQHLRAKRFNNLKFKRQVPMGNYIVDFSCDEKKLVIELDGGQHSVAQSQDKIRDAFLRKEGYTVLRFWNNEIDNDIEAVLEKINEVTTSLPTSPLARGEG